MASLIFKTVNLLVAQPTGLWEKIILAFNSVFTNYAWAIIVLTLCIKIVLSPFDYFNKKISKNNAKAQAVMQPEMQALQTKYGNDKNLLNQKTQELYKKNNVNLFGSCIFMLVNLIITFVVFITLFSGMNNMASYKVKDQYEQLQTVYNQAVTDNLTEEQRNNLIAEKYEDIKDGWLWIDNIWLADSPFKESILTFDEYISTTKEEFVATETKTKEEVKAEAKTEYDLIMTPLRESRNRANGYFILTIIAVASAIGTQLITQKFTKKKLVDPQQASTNKVMLILMPAMLGYFTLMYNAIFGLYIVTGQLFGMITTPLIELLQTKIEKNKIDKDYSTHTFKKARVVGSKNDYTK